MFILFDTSNRMYSSFPYVCDAIRDFTRRLAPVDSVAIYTFSRNLFRAAPLTQDHVAARAGLSNISAGDDTALFNSILLTLRDAAQVPGRKAIVVFSNGPDNASAIGPDDVGRVAENEGIPIYVISSRDAVQDPVLYDALQNLTTRSGGKLYCARNWQQQVEAFTSVREDIGKSYTAYYYPAAQSEPRFSQHQGRDRGSSRKRLSRPGPSRLPGTERTCKAPQTETDTAYFFRRFPTAGISHSRAENASSRRRYGSEPPPAKTYRRNA